MNTAKIAAAYLRVSDDRQDEYSPDSQLKKIREYCTANSYELPDGYIFYDDGISGKSVKKRDQFRDLIALAKDKEHPIDAILVWKFSRFARNQEESIVYKSLLAKIGVTVVSISEPLPDGPFGSLVERIIEWMDEYYLTRLSGEVKRGMLEKASRGKPVTVPAFGYDLRDDTYYPNKDAETVREIFSAFISGKGMREIAVHLGNSGVRTKFGNLPDNRWIEYILNNPVYIGKIRWSTEGRTVSRRQYDDPNTIIFDGHHNPIITEDVWKAAQALLLHRKTKYAKNARREQPPSTFSLRSLFRCSACGATLVQTHTKIPSLQCHNYSRGTCTISHSITQKKAEAALADALEYSIRTLSFHVTPKPELLSSPDNLDIEKSIAAEQRRLQRAKDAYQNGVDTLEEYAENKKRITKRIRDLESQLKPVDPVSVPVESYATRVADALNLLRDPDADPGLKNSVLLEVLEKVIFHADTRQIDVYFRPL